MYQPGSKVLTYAIYTKIHLNTFIDRINLYNIFIFLEFPEILVIGVKSISSLNFVFFFELYDIRISPHPTPTRECDQNL